MYIHIFLSNGKIKIRYVAKRLDQRLPKLLVFNTLPQILIMENNWLLYVGSGHSYLLGNHSVTSTCVYTFDYISVKL